MKRERREKGRACKRSAEISTRPLKENPLQCQKYSMLRTLGIGACFRANQLLSQGLKTTHRPQRRQRTNLSRLSADDKNEFVLTSPQHLALLILCRAIRLSKEKLERLERQSRFLRVLYRRPGIPVFRNRNDSF